MTTLVVCVRNSVELLRRNLPALRTELPEAELIVVDGASTDGSAEYARTIADIVVSDEGKGLAYARMLGITRASRPYVLFAGPDNRISRDLECALRDALENDPKLAGVQPQTRVVCASNYWENFTRVFFQQFINHPGEVDVIGTPCMFRREIILSVPYDPRITAGADDTDLSLRLRGRGYKLRMIDAYSEETMPLNREAFFSRWKWYGKGDAEFYAKHRRDWTWRRKLRSLAHPLYTYGIKGAWKFIRTGKPQYIPGLWYAVFARYAGWLTHRV